MFLSEPAPTSADMRFTLAGIPVRVSAWFWVGAALLGWGMCQWLSRGDQRELLRLLVAWVAVVFVSILLHEMGHALAWRAFGKPSNVVLYHFGGLTSLDGWGRRFRRTPREQLIVSAAGPIAQLLLAAGIVIALKSVGYAVPFPIEPVSDAFELHEGRRLPSSLLAAVVMFLLYVNVFWPLLNLVPVPPLDGGQIVREGLEWIGVPDARRIASMLGAVCGGLVGWWAMTGGETYMAILFFMLAASCIQSLGGR